MFIGNGLIRFNIDINFEKLNVREFNGELVYHILISLV